ncbi:MAG: hypothetical protein LLG06_04300 [Desulfobacteraceae bacterium]|nr:hypothetical protein [Desulfobacteraceae bacterium]
MPGISERCAPVVCKFWLVLVAGLVWFCVGVALMLVACFRLYESPWPLNLMIAAGSVLLGVVISRGLFSRIVSRNLGRIGRKPEASCIFAFQGWRSYLLVVLMMFIGYALRHLPIPHYIDALIYLAMGTALAFSSSLYFAEFSAIRPGR